MQEPGVVTQGATFLLGLAFSTAATVLIKVIFTLETVNGEGEIRAFEKPLFTTWAMFLGMALALPLYFIVRWYRLRQSSKTERKRLLLNNDQDDDEDEDLEIPWGVMLGLIVPSLFDLVGTALAQAGLLYISVSLYQLVRTAVMIVHALLRASVLGESLQAFMWAGIALNAIAMVMVCLTAFLSPDIENPDVPDPRWGILFLLLSCVVQGCQFVFEEKMMEKMMLSYSAHPLLVVGMEGFWGSVLLPLVVFPIAFYMPGSDAGGSVENLVDSIQMVANNPWILGCVVAFVLTVLLHYVFAIYVTHLLTAVWHAVLDNFRPVSVWGVDLLLFYVFTAGALGEAWTTLSWLQLGGMLVLFAGTAVFNGSLQLPGFRYPDPDADDDGSTYGSSVGSPYFRHGSTPSMMSPHLTRSPMLYGGGYTPSPRGWGGPKTSSRTIGASSRAVWNGVPGYGSYE